MSLVQLQFLGVPWVKHRLGKCSFHVWLMAHSYFYGHVQNLNRLFRLDRTVFTDIGTSNYDKTGFLPKNGKAKEINVQAALEDAQRWLKNYQVLPENMEGIERIANFSKQGIQVIFFEVPVLESYYSNFGNGKQDYDNFVSAVSGVSKEFNIFFIKTSEYTIFPEEAWWNENHLNLVGANIFSRWLGEQVGSLLKKDVSIP